MTITTQDDERMASSAEDAAGATDAAVPAGTETGSDADEGLEAARPRTDLAGWLHLLRLGLARSVLWFVASLGFFAVVLAPMPGFSASVIASGSMRPVIGAGDVVVVRELGEDTDVLGRVVTADDPAHPGTRLTHRVVTDLRDGTYVTRGDANADPDSTPMPRGNIEGRGFLLVPWIGLPIDWIADGEWLRLIVTLAGLVGIGYAAVDRHRLDEDDTGVLDAAAVAADTTGDPGPGTEPGRMSDADADRGRAGTADLADERPRRERAKAMAGTAAAVLAVIAVLAPAGTGRSAAAYVAAADNADNNWAVAGALVDNDGGAPMFSGTTLWAGVRTSKVIDVTYQGTGTADVRLATEAVTGALSPKLRVSVERGARTGGAAFPDATGFTPTAVVAADTTLGALASGIDTGWRPTNGQTASFRISVWYPNSLAGPAATDVAGFGLRWTDASRLTTRPTDNTGNALGARLTYPDRVNADSPILFYRFNDSGARATPAANSSTAPDRLAAGEYNSWITYGSSTQYANPPALVQATPNVDRYGALTSDDYVSSPSRAASPTSVTVEAWVRVTSPDHWGTIASWGTSQTGLSGTMQHRLYIGRDNIVRFGTVAPFYIFRGAASPAPLTSGGWHLVQGTVDASGTRLYIDGQLVGTGPTPPAPPLINSGFWRVGWQVQELGLPGLTAGAINAFNGGTDEVAVYTRALDAATLRSHYEAGIGRPVSGAAAAPMVASTSAGDVDGAETASVDATATTAPVAEADSGAPEVSEPEPPADSSAPAPELEAPPADSSAPAPEVEAPAADAGAGSAPVAEAPAPEPDPQAAAPAVSVSEAEQALLDLLAVEHGVQPEEIDLLAEALVTDGQAAAQAGVAQPFERPGDAVAAWLERRAREAGLDATEVPDPDDAVGVLVWHVATTGTMPESGTPLAELVP